MVEHSAVNRVVVGSSPTRGVFFFLGSMVKRLRHRPFTAVTRVQIPLESFLAQQCAELKVISRISGKLVNTSVLLNNFFAILIRMDDEETIRYYI